jgi:AcrR family transcriptional regulator
VSSRSARTRSALLDAAERLVERDGAARLTLEGIADEAGISKGGLLYHYASKDDLIAAMLDRRFAGFDAALRTELAAEPPAPGAHLRAWLRATAAEEGPEAAAGLLAAVARNRDLLRPLQERYAAWQEELEANSGLSPAGATLLRLVADGLWMSELLGFAPPENGLKKDVLELAHQLSHSTALGESSRD